MSLRVRLVLLILLVVALAAVALSAVHLETLVNLLTSDAIERSNLTGDQVSALLRDHIERDSGNYPAPQDLAEIKALWNGIVANDSGFHRLLTQMMASSGSLLEINIAGEDGTILASSNPPAIRTPLQRRQNFETWGNTPWYRRLLDLRSRHPDWEITLPLGVGQQDQPVFTIQVVTSSVFLRDALRPQIVWLAWVSGAAIGLSLLLTVLVTTRALRPVKRIEDTIDRIAQGQIAASQPDGGMSKEFRAVENKLNLLGQKYQGAREDASELRHNVDRLLERMASQLDVATRLAAISRLTGGVAHEIKNPLNAIALRLELLRARLGDPDPEVSSQIDILSKEVLRLDRVVKTFLDFSRPVEVHLEDIDLAALVREVTEFVAPQAKEANIQVEFTAPSEPATMRGDSDLLKQAVLNLVVNAVDAMPGGGQLRVALEKGQGEKADDKLILEVSDTGPGIPPELRDKVFQLYFTTKLGGSGIGLAMTYRAVQLHNGTISFKSEAGRGTTFRLEFPANVQHA
ncbi:MAG TPA: ATP-binding protein [Bryobacteraceae bacterium]|nr:ATP-binding protein [Bryobacteraceae bacterium]